jgi:hypothetical protein
MGETEKQRRPDGWCIDHEKRLASLENRADWTDYALIALAVGLAALFGIVVAESALGAEVAPSPLVRLLAAIREVESGGPGDHDGGRALPPYEIHRDYWTDSLVPGRWEDCLREPYARRVVLAYMRRYEPAALARVDAETLARLHNGGPTWRAKPTTIAYWHKVRAAMEATQ